MKLEIISPQEIKISRSEDEKQLVVEGYAAVYNSESKPMYLDDGRMIVERILPNAFDDVLANLYSQRKDCVATYEHDRSTLLARTSSGTLTLKSDDYGLWFMFSVPNTTIGNDVAVKLERGDLRNCSFVATALKADISMVKSMDGSWIRDIKKFNALYDISLVVDAAYYGTYVDEIKRNITDIEKEEADALAKEENIKRQLEHENAIKESQFELLNQLITRAEL